MQYTEEDKPDREEDEGLSGGQIAGIVIGCVVGVPIIIHVLAAVISLSIKTVRTMF